VVTLLSSQVHSQNRTGSLYLLRWVECWSEGME